MATQSLLPNPSCLTLESLRVEGGVSVFAERLPAVAERYARKTCRLGEALRELAYLAGGEAAARIARSFGLLVSPDALLESLHRSPLPGVATPRVLGVDD